MYAPPENSNVLVVGAGGIGCELLKNLAYSGFTKITIIDLDTIDVSNLNRQFLFRKIHVGKSKAEVAVQSVLQFRSDVNLKAYHASIFSSQFGPEFFKNFDIVFNALDNQAARRHVNRMCVHIRKPLVESGTSGYLGQVEPLLYTGDSVNPHSACFECQPRKNDRRSYPTCTIRNTPSEPIHCVVWAKFLFNQLFGEIDDDSEDISPDVNDPDAHMAIENSEKVKSLPAADNTVNSSLWARVSTNEDFSTIEEAIAWRLFNTDILTLLSMTSLWENRPERKQPIPLDRDTLASAVNHPGLDGEGDKTDSLRDQRAMDLPGWISLFISSCRILRERAGLLGNKNAYKALVWDKDNSAAMDFVASASIVRAILFHVPGGAEQTRFTVKSLAGNIVPAIATTNAVIAGAMVLQGLHILHSRLDAVRTVFLHRLPGPFGRFLTTCRPIPPNPKCLVCTEGPSRLLHLICNPQHLKLSQLRESVLIRRLGMIAPDVEIDGKGVILISSDEDETKDIEHKSLAEFHLTGDGPVTHRLRCDDFRQNMTFYLQIVADSSPSRQDESWILEGDLETPLVHASPEELNPQNAEAQLSGSKRLRNDAHDEPNDEDDAGLEVLEDEGPRPSKLPKMDDISVEEEEEEDRDEDLVVLD